MKISLQDFCLCISWNNGVLCTHSKVSASRITPGMQTNIHVCKLKEGRHLKPRPTLYTRLYSPGPHRPAKTLEPLWAANWASWWRTYSVIHSFLFVRFIPCFSPLNREAPKRQVRGWKDSEGSAWFGINATLTFLQKPKVSTLHQCHSEHLYSADESSKHFTFIPSVTQTAVMGNDAERELFVFWVHGSNNG